VPCLSLEAYRDQKERLTKLLPAVKTCKGFRKIISAWRRAHPSPSTKKYFPNAHMKQGAGRALSRIAYSECPKGLARSAQQCCLRRAMTDIHRAEIWSSGHQRHLCGCMPISCTLYV